LWLRLRVEIERPSYQFSIKPALAKMCEETRRNQSHTCSIEYKTHKSMAIVSMVGTKDTQGIILAATKESPNSHNSVREEKSATLRSEGVLLVALQGA
jgi:hypothetical protein